MDCSLGELGMVQSKGLIRPCGRPPWMSIYQPATPGTHRTFCVASIHDGNFTLALAAISIPHELFMVAVSHGEVTRGRKPRSYIRVQPLTRLTLHVPKTRRKHISMFYFVHGHAGVVVRVGRLKRSKKNRLTMPVSKAFIEKAQVGMPPRA